MNISIEQLDASARRYSALTEDRTPERVTVFSEEALIPEVQPEITRGNILGADENLAKRKQMLETLGTEPVDFAFERAIGNNDSVYSNFAELIHTSKQKVGRIAIKQGNRNIGFATGFMVAENLLLTNWHVFKKAEEVADSEVQFFYEYDIFGRPGIPVSFQFDTQLFFHSSTYE